MESGHRPGQHWLRLVGTMHNQNGKLVIEGSAKVLLRERLAREPTSRPSPTAAMRATTK